MGIYKLWTDAEITQLKRLVNERKTIAQMAAILGRPAPGVRDKKNRLGLCIPPKLSSDCPKTLAQIIKFKMAGWHTHEVAKVFGSSTPSISRILCDNGFKGVFRAARQKETACDKWSEWDLIKLRRYCKKGYGIERICTYFRYRTRAAIRLRIWEMTRYWMTPEQQEERRLAKEREWQWRVY